VEVIPNGLDTGVFRPRGRDASRNLLGLPRDRKIILFGAVRGISDPNKGLHLLKPALQEVGSRFPDAMALVFSAFDRVGMTEMGMPSVFLGEIRDDERLAAVYSAADVFVAPSLQETFCQTAAEAMACGTPVVAFGATGLPDVVEHRRTGYLAQPYDTEDLARGIAWVLEDADRQADLSRRSRLKVEADFALPETARRYVEQYRRILRG
jgi:glycosyltransferase involved in cell wall biosynthesis